MRSIPYVAGFPPSSGGERNWIRASWIRASCGRRDPDAAHGQKLRGRSGRDRAVDRRDPSVFLSSLKNPPNRTEKSLTLLPIQIPDSLREIPIADTASRLIDDANDRIEAFMLADHEVIENFVTCDFHLLEQALQWLEQNHLLTGNRFCELGSGFGVGAMLASLRGMEAVGIEIESVLVQQSSDLATVLGNAAEFYCGSFVPRDVAGLSQWARDIKNVVTDEGDVYEEIGLAMDDFDLFFAFPWPGEHTFFENVVDACGADGALLLTYRGREGMNLVRKT